ncbi:MAG TPA: MerR family transcriptional regulator [Pseudolabrys sp.]|nr:MerR family transcriptional regulator [Pseudolabrys sp.]
MDHKAPDAFRTISEVADELDLPQHVLRFWESRFREIKPMKRGGGRRYYRPDDVDLLRGIRHLLYGEGYTIRGVQRILREHGSRFVEEVWREGAAQPPHVAVEDQDFDDEATRDSPDETDADRGGGLLEPPLAASSRRAENEDRAEASAAAFAESFTDEDVSKLRAALDELGECRKLLDEALAQAG